jgi:hypothetical protein
MELLDFPKRELDHGRNECVLQREIPSVPKPKVEDLCDRCQAIDFDAIFGLGKIPPTHGLGIMPLGKLDKEAEASDCPVCRLFADMRGLTEASSDRRRHGYHLRAFSSFTIYPPKQRGNPPPCIGLGVLRGQPRKKIDEKERKDCISRGLIIPSADISPSVNYLMAPKGVRVDGSIKNYKRMKQWLSDCRRWHTEVCGQKKSPRPKLLRCIDSISRAILSITESEEFFALSYVWGPPNFENEEGSKHFDSLPASGVPKVVEDALTVVKKLGRRYLWVDRYCIDQRHSGDLHTQLREMDRVYENASATIVAAAGTNVNAGLVGVGQNLRKPQPSVMAGDKLLVSTLPHMSQPLNSSTWFTRGWTYQEAVLSKRCLFFTELQVYFVCEAMTCCEAVDPTNVPFYLTPPSSQESSDGTLGTEIFAGTGNYSNAFQKFMNHVEQYTARNLTYETDAINAFRGLLARLPFPSYYGVPIAPDDIVGPGVELQEVDIGFARGLCWKSKLEDSGKSLTRRPDFPSWSWAGWAGRIGFHQGWSVVENDYVAADISTFTTKFRVQTSSGLSTLKGMFKASRANCLPEKSNVLLIDADIVQVRLQRCRSKQIRFCVCDCHPDSSHGGMIASGECTNVATLCEVPDERGDFYKRLLTQLWDCVVLFQMRRVNNSLPGPMLMLVNWDGKIAHRIGLITLQNKLFETLPKMRKRIRLG